MHQIWKFQLIFQQEFFSKREKICGKCPCTDIYGKLGKVSLFYAVNIKRTSTFKAVS